MKKLFGFALGIITAAAFALPVPALAISWNFECAIFCGLTFGAAGNERSFTSASEVLSARAFATPNSDGSGNFLESYLGQYDTGLGVTSPGIALLGNGDGLGLGNSHTVDNNGKHDLIVFRMPSPLYLPASVFLDAFGDTDIDVWVGGNGLSFSNFTSLSYATLAANGFISCSAGNSGATSDRTANFSSCNLAGQYLIIGADNNGSNDEFKISSLTANASPSQGPSSVPEPSAMILFGFGLIGLRLIVTAHGRQLQQLPAKGK
jgi:hypothetical protein